MPSKSKKRSVRWSDEVVAEEAEDSREADEDEEDEEEEEDGGTGGWGSSRSEDEDDDETSHGARGADDGTWGRSGDKGTGQDGEEGDEQEEEEEEEDGAANPFSLYRRTAHKQQAALHDAMRAQSQREKEERKEKRKEKRAMVKKERELAKRGVGAKSSTTTSRSEAAKLSNLTTAEMLAAAKKAKRTGKSKSKVGQGTKGKQAGGGGQGRGGEAAAGGRTPQPRKQAPQPQPRPEPVLAEAPSSSSIRELLDSYMDMEDERKNAGGGVGSNSSAAATRDSEPEVLHHDHTTSSHFANPHKIQSIVSAHQQRRWAIKTYQEQQEKRRLQRKREKLTKRQELLMQGLSEEDVKAALASWGDMDLESDDGSNGDGDDDEEEEMDEQTLMQEMAWSALARPKWNTTKRVQRELDRLRAGTFDAEHALQEEAARYHATQGAHADAERQMVFESGKLATQLTNVDASLPKYVQLQSLQGTQEDEGKQLLLKRKVGKQVSKEWKRSVSMHKPDIMELFDGSARQAQSCGLPSYALFGDSQQKTGKGKGGSRANSVTTTGEGDLFAPPSHVAWVEAHDDLEGSGVVGPSRDVRSFVHGSMTLAEEMLYFECGR